MNATKGAEFNKPQTLREVANRSGSIGDFGTNLRDWQHVVSRSVTSKPEFLARVSEAPPLLRDLFSEGAIADAYLAAYAEWLCRRAKAKVPVWVGGEGRSLQHPWYADRNESQLERLAPDSFAKRNVFTVPDPVFRPRRGRPRVPEEASRHKRIERQRAYRQRIMALVDVARRLKR